MEQNFDILEVTKTIANIVEDHVLVCNLDGRIIFSNEAMQSNLGYNDTELKEKGLSDIMEDMYINKVQSFIKGASEESSGWEAFLFNGKNDLIQLQVKMLKKNHLLYIYGNEEHSEYEKMRKRLDVEIANAIKIHKRFLPDILPSTEKISFASLYIPAQDLGGDLFDVFKVDNDLLDDYFEQYVCFVADVSGHGLDSAMLAIFVKDTISSYFKLKHIPGQVLSPKEIMDFFVEHYMKAGYPMEYLVCLFFVVFDLKTQELIYCNAGFHKCPILVTDKDHVIELNKGGFPISTAIPENLYNYKDHVLQLTPEMTLFIMSDGLPEQEYHNEFYEERLKKLITKIHHQASEDIIEIIHADFNDFVKDEDISDDITLVVAKVLKQ